MLGAPIERAAKLAGRTSGDSTVAYAIAFARAVEAALGIEAPPRAQWLRALMAELERMANHLGDFGAICNDASFSLMLAQCGRAARARAAHLRCLLRPSADDGSRGAGRNRRRPRCCRRLEPCARSSRACARHFPPLVTLYDNTASLQDRTVTTGILKPELARLYGAGGYVGRASGRPFDARRTPGYAPYTELTFEVPVRDDGDVNARVWIRIREIEESLALIEEIVERLPAGPVCTESPRRDQAIAKASRSPRRSAATFSSGCASPPTAPSRAHYLRDASWFQWPLLEAAIEGNIVADFPLCNKSFNCSYSGHDL